MGRDKQTIRMVCGSHLLVKRVDFDFRGLDWSLCFSVASLSCCVLSWQASKLKKKLPMPL